MHSHRNKTEFKLQTKKLEKTTFVSLQGNDIYKQKNELTSFINDNGVNVTQTVLNLSDQAQEVTKIVKHSL